MRAPLFLLVALLGSVFASGQMPSGPAAAPSTPPPACTAPEFRQFDFWIGLWDVYVKGKLAGQNDVTREQDGCLLVEHWKSLRGAETGESFNYYDVADRKWHQLYIANNGIAQTYPPIAGTFADHRMTLVDEKDPKNFSRWIWTDMGDGKVRQMAEQSADGGKHWTTVWDSIYVKRMPMHAAGTFDVKVVPQSPDNEPAKAANLGRMSLDKQFHGDLEAASKGEMLSAMGNEKGSGAYVAIERVTGTLGGKKGSFALYHHGTMERGAQSLIIRVVPDSGTDGLQGLTGSMTITIEGGRHSYGFDYSLPSQP